MSRPRILARVATQKISLNGTNREEVVADLLAWIQSVAPQPVQATALNDRFPPIAAISQNKARAQYRIASALHLNVANMLSWQGICGG